MAEAAWAEDHADGTPGGEETFFSMLSPNGWGFKGGKCPYEYLNSYRLEHDMSWTPVERIVERDNRRKFCPSLLGLTDAQAVTGSSQLRLTLLCFRPLRCNLCLSRHFCHPPCRFCIKRCSGHLCITFCLF